MNNPKVSIIVPIYNLQDYLKNCIDSLIAQTLKDIEIILVNDGSEDNSGRICDDYAKLDKRIKVIHRANGGVSSARNAGIDAASGEYTGFADGDDYAACDMFGILYNNAKENDADISHSGLYYVKGKEKFALYGTEEKTVEDKFSALYNFLAADKREPTVCTKIYKKSLLKNIRFDENLRHNEDTLFNYRAFSESQKSVFYDLPLYYYVRRENSAVQSARKKCNGKTIADVIDVAHEIYTSSKDLPEKIRHAAYARLIGALINSLVHPHIKKQDKPLYKKNRQLLNVYLKQPGYKALDRVIKYKAKIALRYNFLYRFARSAYNKLKGKKTSIWED